MPLFSIAPVMADAWPPAPPAEDTRDAHCGRCGSLFHATDDHADQTTARAWERGLRVAEEFPAGYDPGEADRLIGRDPFGT